MAEDILIGLGGNIPSPLGSPRETIKRALTLLEQEGMHTLVVSSVYQTAPVPVSDQPDFINIAVRAKADYSAAQLLNIFQKIEVGCGRKPAERWSARTLDIDLLAHGDQILPTKTMWQSVVDDSDPAAILPEPVVPHPRLHKRAFVLVPLVEVAPDWRHPVLGEVTKNLVAAGPIRAESTGVLKISRYL